MMLWETAAAAGTPPPPPAALAAEAAEAVAAAADVDIGSSSWAAAETQGISWLFKNVRVRLKIEK